MTDASPLGNVRLMRQIARRYLENGMPTDPNWIVIAVGATEAINPCIQAVAILEPHRRFNDAFDGAVIPLDDVVRVFVRPDLDRH